MSVEGGYNSGAIRLPFVFYDAVPAASYQKVSVGLGILIVSANRLVYIPKSRTGWLYNQPVPYFLRVAAR